MCDTVVATGEATLDGVTILGKSTDRDANEAHHLLHVPAADHVPGSEVQCTYVSVPQVEHTHAVILAKPYWIWGAEMGVNEWNVAIGNEAVFTRVPYEKDKGLIGMDFLRLGLERGRTAREALATITDLLDTYGQGGNCTFGHEMYYHNSYLIADPQDAWLLETAGPHWAAVQVRGVRTISNCLSIGNRWDMASSDLVSYAVDRGWCRRRADFHFARCYSDFLYTRFAYGRERSAHTCELLNAEYGAITVRTIMQLLRDHPVSEAGPRRPDQSPLTGAMVCMHASLGPIRISQTTGSMVSYLQPEHATHFFTATAAPCTSIFKPVWVDAELPDTGPVPCETYDGATLYWRHESLHRATLRDYSTRIGLYARERDVLESEFVQGALDRAKDKAEDRTAFSAHCFSKADEAEASWLKRLRSARLKARPNLLFRWAWARFNKRASMPEL